jgi:uncharacterized protein YbjT (DUF2867 family)
MKILLSGVTGYIGKRLLYALLEDGHEIVCCVRDANRLDLGQIMTDRLSSIEVNFLDPLSLAVIPNDIDVAYYLIHSMSASTDNFEKLEIQCAENFKNRLEATAVKQVVYLSGIVNQEKLSKHLKSRKGVEKMLSSASFPLTTLRAGIIIGSGSASFEIMRDLVEKLPLMITPQWLNTRSQPIAIRNVIQFLKGVLLMEKTYDKSFDIGGPEIMTYKEMLLGLAKVRKLKRFIFIVPVMTPKLSSYWLYFVTSTSYKLAVNLVHSMKVEVVCKKNDLSEWLNIELISYQEALKQAFDKIEQHDVMSSWTDALSSKRLERNMKELIQIPQFGCLRDKRQVSVKNEEETQRKIWAIGGENGWYYADWLWNIRGFLDKVVGGVGLRRGRKNPDHIKAGESLDFWRVIYASQEEKRLLLYAEMKLPGEAWLEFFVKNGQLYQTATFRPKGLFGRLYWYSLLPFHHFIFNGMMARLAR